MRTRVLFACLMLLALLMSSCAPTLEASNPPPPTWTPTPAPTPTTTPIPYRLAVHIFDESGQPIAGAQIVLPESGSNQPASTDASGQYEWGSLTEPSATLYVSAPGYSSAVQPVSLQAGLTEMALFLRPDPFALLPADACAPGETLRYMEDFQDNQAQGWPEITKALAGTDNGWSISAAEEGNQAASFTGIQDGLDHLEGLSLQDFVWRMRVRTDGGDGYSILDFKQAAPAGSASRYAIQWGAGQFLDLARLGPSDAAPISLTKGQFQPKPQRWYYFEISDYKGQIRVWVDGRKQVEEQDASPLPAGTIGLEAHIPTDVKTVYYFDNISACELTAPFTASNFKPGK